MQIRLIILFIILFISSCSNPKKTRGSKSNLLAYYNTFYMAEKFFDEALNDIETNNGIENGISEKAIDLLNKSMANALVIEQRFYETKYLDDAYYILAKSSYLLNRMTSSRYYFNRIITDYSDNEYAIESSIWLCYINLKTGQQYQARDGFKQLENDYVNYNKYQKYLTNLLGADISETNNDSKKEKSYCLLALKNSSNKYQRINLNERLLNISDREKDYQLAIDCIEDIEENSDNKIENDLLKKWFEYNRNLGKTDNILKKIKNSLDKTINVKDIIFFKLEEVHVLSMINRIDESFEILHQLIDEYSNNDVLKNELSEIHYVYGELLLLKNKNLEESEIQFQKSLEISENSVYGKQSSSYVANINEFNNLNDDIIYYNSIEGFDENESLEQDSSKVSLMPMPEEKNEVKIDSLEYSAAQVLYFDIGLKDSAITRFKKIVEVYPKSDFAYKSLIILNMQDPSNGWNDLIEESFPNYIIKDDTPDDLDLKRNEAWDMLSVSYNQSINLFINIYKELNDSHSLYMAAYISDHLFNDINQAVSFYNEYLIAYPNGENIDIINNRLSDIGSMLEEKIISINQRINYRTGKYWIDNGMNVDSSIYYLNQSISGSNLSLRSSAESLISSLNDYSINKDIFDNFDPNNNMDIDSVRFNLANFLYKDINFENDAIKYYKDIVNESENLNYINSSLAALDAMEPNNGWDSLLFVNTNDSSLFNMLINNNLRNEPYKIIGTKTSDSLDFIWFEELHKKLFPEIINVIDTSKVIEDDVKQIEKKENIKSDTR